MVEEDRGRQEPGVYPQPVHMLAQVRGGPEVVELSEYVEGKMGQQIHFRNVLRTETPPKSVSAANPHLLRFSQICPRLANFWSFSLLRRNRRPAAQSQDQTYIFLMCRI